MTSLFGGSVVYWLERRTSHRNIAGSTPGRCIAGQSRSTQSSLPPGIGVGKSSTSLLAEVKVGRVHLCRVAANTV